jgi:hypothetical protein
MDACEMTSRTARVNPFIHERGGNGRSGTHLENEAAESQSLLSDIR